MKNLLVILLLCSMIASCGKPTHCPVAKTKVYCPSYIEVGVAIVPVDNWCYVCPVEEIKNDTK